MDEIKDKVLQLENEIAGAILSYDPTEVFWSAVLYVKHWISIHFKKNMYFLFPFLLVSCWLPWFKCHSCLFWGHLDNTLVQRNLTTIPLIMEPEIVFLHWTVFIKKYISNIDNIQSEFWCNAWGKLKLEIIQRTCVQI